MGWLKFKKRKAENDIEVREEMFEELKEEALELRNSFPDEADVVDQFLKDFYEERMLVLNPIDEVK